VITGNAAQAQINVGAEWGFWPLIHTKRSGMGDMFITFKKSIFYFSVKFD
jgi:hypothetical protein